MEGLQIVYYVVAILAGIAAIAGFTWRFVLRGRGGTPPDILYVKRDISEKDFSKGVDWLMKKITKEYNPDLILVISSGGATVGGILSRHLNIPLAIITRSNPRVQETEPTRSEILVFPSDELIRGRRVLLVDDIVRAGSTLQTSLKKTREAGPLEIKSAALLLAGEHPSEKPDFYIYEAQKPRLRIFYDYHRAQRQR